MAWAGPILPPTCHLDARRIDKNLVDSGPSPSPLGIDIFSIELFGINWQATDPLTIF